MPRARNCEGGYWVPLVACPPVPANSLAGTPSSRCMLFAAGSVAFDTLKHGPPVLAVAFVFGWVGVALVLEAAGAVLEVAQPS